MCVCVLCRALLPPKHAWRRLSTCESTNVDICRQSRQISTSTCIDFLHFCPDKYIFSVLRQDCRPVVDLRRLLSTLVDLIDFCLFLLRAVRASWQNARLSRIYVSRDSPKLFKTWLACVFLLKKNLLFSAYLAPMATSGFVFLLFLLLTREESFLSDTTAVCLCVWWVLWGVVVMCSD